MILDSLIRGELTALDKVATMTPATSATGRRVKEETVANVATVTVANHSINLIKPTQKSLIPLSRDEEEAILAWLSLINETDPVTIAKVIQQCKEDSEDKEFFMLKTKDKVPKSLYVPDDQRNKS